MTDEIWTGQLSQLPTERPSAALLRRAITRRHDAFGGAFVIHIRGMVDTGGWIRLGALIKDGLDSEFKRILITVDSRTSIAKGAGVAMAAIATCNQTKPIDCWIEHAGGAALAVASCCQTLTADAGALIGPMDAAPRYETENGEPSAADIGQLLQAIVDRPRDGAIGLVAGAACLAKTIDERRVRDAMSYLCHFPQ